MLQKKREREGKEGRKEGRVRKTKEGKKEMMREPMA